MFDWASATTPAGSGYVMLADPAVIGWPITQKQLAAIADCLLQSRELSAEGRARILLVTPAAQVAADMVGFTHFWPEQQATPEQVILARPVAGSGSGSWLGYAIADTRPGFYDGGVAQFAA